MTQPVLDIQQLHLSFPGFNGDVHALNNVSLQINRGEIVGLVGESGSGKSVTAMLIMRLLPTGSYCVHRGQISLLGEDVLNAREKQLRQWRGARVAMIFQEPMTALNPTRRIGLQMMDVIRHHQPISRREARAKAIALLEEMQIPDAVEVMSRYPFELSGGMRQRVMIALAFSCEPQLIIADEPTTALDVTVQLQVLRLLKHKARASGTAVLFISHDMAVVSQLCDSVYVMDANNASGIHAPDASSGNALRFQLVIQRNFRFQYLRDRASCFCFLDDAVKGRGINTRHRNFTLQCDFRNRKTGIHFIQRHIGGGINRCWRESRFPQH